MGDDGNEKSGQEATGHIARPNAGKRFMAFILLVLAGLAVSYLFMRQGFKITAESYRDYVLSLGLMGPIIYIALFIVRPLFLIPSIALFIAGGLAFGPVWGPAYASAGAAMGGALGFWVARRMGRDFVMSKLKLGAGVVKTATFSFSAVFLLSLLPVMPVTAVNYGAGLSAMKFKNYLLAHVLGLTPRAFAYGFFGSALTEIGSPKFRVAVLILLFLVFLTAFLRLRSRQTNAGAPPYDAPLPETE